MTRIQKKKPSHLAVSASKKNAGVASQFMSSDTGTGFVAARVEANLGSYFRLVAHNGTCCIQVIGSPRGLFKQRRADIRLAVNDIVLVSGLATMGTCEIVCRLEKADAHSLHKDGKIHTLVYRSASALETVEEDDIFESPESTKATTYGESPESPESSKDTPDVNVDSI
jgi:hypothetical protein